MTTLDEIRSGPAVMEKKNFISRQRIFHFVDIISTWKNMWSIIQYPFTQGYKSKIDKWLLKKRFFKRYQYIFTI